MMELALIPSVLREISVYWDLEQDRMRSNAYARAAAALEALDDDVMRRLWSDERLTDVSGIGKSIAGVIRELAATGTADVLERLRTAWPKIVVDLARLPGVGPVKAHRIHKQLAPTDLRSVAALCRAGVVAELPGFGDASQAHVLEAIETRERLGERKILSLAASECAELAHYLEGLSLVSQVLTAGQVRRGLEVVSRLALVVVSDEVDLVVDHLRAHPLTSSFEQRGHPLTVFDVALVSGMHCDVYVGPTSRLGWMLIEATGSVEHVTALKERALQHGLNLSTFAGATESDLYRALGLPWLPPEVRDGTDELTVADAGDDFSDLVTVEMITGAFHCHTTYSDGRHSAAEMAAAATVQGMKLITITDHSAAASYARGLSEERLREQARELASLRTTTPIRILHGTEADIGPNGEIDVPESILPQLDIVVASVHRRDKQDSEAMTARLITAMRRPFFKIWGHPLGRLILRRNPIACRIDDVLDAIAESPAAIEINGDPHRLDFDPVNARNAKARGIRFVLSSDAHSIHGLDNIRYAVTIARRARLRCSDVINTHPPDQIAEIVRPRPRP